MNYILFDGDERQNLLPFTFTRPVADIRIGIITIREKWERYLNAQTSTLTEAYLQEKFPLQAGTDNCYINGAVLPDTKLVDAIHGLQFGQSLKSGETIVAMRLSTGVSTYEEFKKGIDTGNTKQTTSEIHKLEHVWDIFSKNGDALKADFELITKGRTSAAISNSNQILGAESLLFIEEGAVVECSILNTTTGPIYIGKDAEVMEGSMIRGPFALCEHSATKLGTKIYGPTTVGPYSKVGGEINNSVIFGYTNKAHDGFLGNSVIGEWCNLGADTNNSNLKNNYSQVQLWDYASQNYIDTGLQFCGLMMGDHSKCGINTMFNTGTVVGVSANIFGGDFPSKHIPSFAWGGADGFTTYRIEQAFEVAACVYERRGLDFDAVEQRLLKSVFEQTMNDRRSFK